MLYRRNDQCHLGSNDQLVRLGDEICEVSERFWTAVLKYRSAECNPKKVETNVLGSLKIGQATVQKLENLLIFQCKDRLVIFWLGNILERISSKLQSTMVMMSDYLKFL